MRRSPPRASSSAVLARYAERIVARTLFRTNRRLMRSLILERERLVMELDAMRRAYERESMAG